MKTFKQSLLPVAILLLGTGSAFATYHAKQNDKAADPVYRIDQPTPCTLVDHECGDIPTTLCSISPGVQVYGMNASGTDCNVTLFEKQ